MQVLFLAQKDLLQLMRDKRTFVFYLIMPIAFTLVFGLVFTDNSKTTDDSRLDLGVLIQDESPGSQMLLEALEETGSFNLVINDNDQVDTIREQVAEGKLSAAVLIPNNYGQLIATDETEPLSLILNYSNSNGINIEQELTSLVLRLKRAKLAANMSTSAYELQQSFDNPEEKRAYSNTAFEKAFSLWQNPPITTIGTNNSQNLTTENEDESQENPFAQFSPGMMMQFAIAGLLGAAEIMVIERKTRSLQRMLSTSMSRFQILCGHFLAIFVIILSQITLLMIFGQLALKLDYLQAPLASGVIAIAISLCFAALGLLIGALSKTSENAMVYSLIPMFVFSGLGGAWMPLEYTSKAVQFVGHLTPVAWGIDGIKNILIRGAGLESAWLPAGILLIFTVIFFGLAAWRFKFE
ncbi:MAG: ABC transporter permease [Anaerolineaceae bacterium]|nr:ABC transporter permease [Anaerolineaceae bacterium]